MRCYALALTLDPADRSAANNLAAAFSNWVVALSGDKKFEDAVLVFGFGESVLGSAGELEQNHRIVWTRYLDAEFDAGRYAEGLKLRERVAAVLPKTEDFQTKAGWFTRAAQRRAKDSWPAAIAVADEGLKRLTGDEANAAAEWQADGYRQWSQELLEKWDVAGALNALVGALAAARRTTRCCPDSVSRSRSTRPPEEGQGADRSHRPLPRTAREVPEAHGDR